ncbi:MAG: tetratricopeptide repeat protein, partial [Bacteroidetes bacterium]|nr:tetratricopeptide repeat protein [Bacteroidota bacterium]
MKYRFFVFIFISFLFPHSTYAQHQVNKRALKLQELAFTHFRQNDTTNAKAFAIKAIAKDSLYANPWVLLGNIYEMQGRNHKAVEAYRQALKLDPINFPDLNYVVGELELHLKNFDGAISQFVTYLSGEIKSKDKQNIAEQSLSIARFRKFAYDNPVDFKAVNLGNRINSSGDDYFNSMSIDQQSIYVTIKKMIGADTEGSPIINENLYIVTTGDTAWNEPRLLTFADKPLNGIGAASISPNNRYLFFTACYQDDGQGSCDLYYAKIEGDKLGNSRNLGVIVNSSAWESQPCFSTDGRTLFFASNRNGGFGGSDIWTSQLDENGNFLPPQNLGSTINTTADEMSPFIHADAKSLYFSSTGHIGLGGFDLFMSRRSNNKNWSKPTNLGYPVNTENDEIALSISADGVTAFISSDQLEGEGGFDIYQFELSELMKSDPVSYIEGHVFDVETGKSLAADIDLIDLSAKQQFTYTQSELGSGKFLVALPIKEMFAFNVSKPGYLFFSAHFPIRK